jgi:hypothetical protein
MNFEGYVRRHFRVRGPGLKQPRLAKTDRVGLAKMLHAMEFNKGVEIGTREGIHSEILCEQNPNIELTCIDPWAPYGRWTAGRQKKFHERTLERIKPYNAKTLKKTSMEALKHFENESLDFAYIDGNHDFDHACADIIFWSEKVKSGGYVGCHDYFECSHCGVVAAVNAYTSEHLIKSWCVTYELTPTAFWIKK